jgi:hypothetical protein
MGYRSAYGYSVTENGWRMIDFAGCDSTPPPGLPGLRLPVHGGDASVILKAWAAWFSTNVENLNNPGRGYSDEGCWTQTNDVGNSNHLSGTALDLNWSEHAFRVSYSGFSSIEIARTRQGLSLFEGPMFWGQDWNTPKDPMHFQLALGEGNPRIAAFAAKLRAGYLGIYSGTPVVTPPPVVVVVGDTRTDLEYGSTGPAVVVLQQGMNKVFPRYRGMPLVVDGDFGPMTESAVKEFQTRDGQCGDVDGIVGAQTRKRLAVYGIKP